MRDSVKDTTAFLGMFIDRGYIASPLVDVILGAGGQVICKPWVARNGKSFAKGDFKLPARPHHHLPRG